jgi:hypothetical protein
MSNVVFKSLLFDEDDYTSAGNLYSSKVQSAKSLYDVEFFCINPLHPTEDMSQVSNTPRRADLNVTKFRNFMFEMDNSDLSTQEFILKECGIPWTSIVYSGGKSLHAILSLQSTLPGCHTEDGILQYKQIWERLASKINNFSHSLKLGNNVVDPSSKNPSRLSRFPAFKAIGRKRQHIVYIGKRIELEDFEILLNTCPYVYKSNILESVNLNVESLNHFMEVAPQPLKDYIKYPFWMKENGNYPQIYKICLWAIDTTGVDKQLMMEIFDKYLVERFEELGYSRERVKLALSHAFKSKGR